MLILGAGMAGLLAAHYFRDMDPQVFDAADGPKDNHQALLRFRSDAVARITGAPLQKVRVLKSVADDDGNLSDKATLRQVNQYSKKVTGKVLPRSIINLEPCDRWIAGPDFMNKLRKNVKVEYGRAVDERYFRTRRDCVGKGLIDWDGDPVISTINIKPIAAVVAPEIVDDLRALPVSVVKATLKDVDAHQTIYVPGMLTDVDNVYRVSIVGSQLIVEMIDDFELSDDEQRHIVDLAIGLFLGFRAEYSDVSLHRQHFGKIVPLERGVRRSLVGTITDEFNIYSLGRFATWRQLLMDDLVGDLETIRSLIENGRYGRKLQYTGAQK